MSDLIERQTAIDADALEKEGWSLHRTIRVDKNTEEYQTKPLKQVPTIEPRCETCEAFNKTRLLIQPERKRGRWIPLQLSIAYPPYQCSCCFRNAPMIETGCLMNRHLEALLTDFCPNCGAEMLTEDKE